MPLTCESLLSAHPDIWHAATVHPFLTQCQEGTIRPAQFNTWLVQDYRFVTEFTRFLGRTLAAAPDQDLDILLSGLNALQDELNWFRDKAAERSLNLDTPRQPTCQTYCEFMGSLVNVPYAVQATALWGIEYAYNQGWQLPGKMPAPYDEFADRWGNPGFTDYVKLLAQQADAALETVPQPVQAAAEAAFLRVAVLEKDFWQMAYGVGYDN
ncbi:TenA family transcriptional regulator [Oscillatoria sp. CS-180]|uniref:TenA family transcriptional regulator n=1 Tax=Oscillatoria sp. CS-180 TaxID=3021720 RepID=UPI002331029B|nr:TenA family transcriptional regulator [Oscillatoria sp. CS-180]MDB9524726.1 TenA family transcriptional regulator [Oscillatoria sp. CS-180]